MSESESEMLTVTMAAREARYDKGALRNVIKAGRLRATKLTNGWLIKRSDLKEWMEGPHYHPGEGRPRKTAKK
jgi:excisionase family DNA binding protein